MRIGPRIFVALDGLTLEKSQEIVRVLERRAGYKIHDLWDQEGPWVVQCLLQNGAEFVWVDLKLKDIPQTVKLRAEAVKRSGAHVLTVHASGEIEMMMAAKAGGPANILAVTVLTSLDEDQTHLLHGNPAKAAVLYMTRLARLADMTGVVCSPREVGLLAKRPELKEMELVVPGIRFTGASIDDQKRVDTPYAAVKAGATRLVVGRAITEAVDPIAAFDRIESEVSAALKDRQEELARTTK